MTAVANMWQMDKRSLIALAGAAIALLMLALHLGFFFRPGTMDVLGGFAQHAFVLGWMLLLTAGSRTVSLPVLGAFWLFGVWGVFGLTYLFQDQLISILGLNVDGNFVPIWLAPLMEEPLKLAPIAIFLLLAARNGYRHPSMSDGLLLGFMVGAGVAFHEDAHTREVFGSGWGAATPWSAVMPSAGFYDHFALNHALWGAFSGLTFSAALMLRHWPWAWAITLIGPLFSFTNHLMWNHFATTEFGTQFLLNRASGADVPWFFQTIRDVTAGGRVTMLALVLCILAVVVAESLILRWVSKRDRMFPALPRAQAFHLLRRATSIAGFAQLIAADSYARLRRAVYYAGWRAQIEGVPPMVTPSDYDELTALRARALRPPATGPVEPAVGRDSPLPEAAGPAAP